MILSCQGDQYSHLDTSSNKICSLLMILSTVVEYVFSSIVHHQRGSRTTCKWSYHDGKRLIQLFRHLKHQNLSTGDDFIYSSGIILLVPFFATKEAVAPHANDPIMLGTLIRLFGHLKYQNLSSNSWDKFLVQFLATREAVAQLANDLIMLGTSIQMFRHLKHQNLSAGDDLSTVVE